MVAVDHRAIVLGVRLRLVLVSPRTVYRRSRSDSCNNPNGKSVPVPTLPIVNVWVITVFE